MRSRNLLGFLIYFDEDTMTPNGTDNARDPNSKDSHSPILPKEFVFDIRFICWTSGWFMAEN